MTASDLVTHRLDFVNAYNYNGGIQVIRPFRSGNCCFAVAGGMKLKIDGSAYGFAFPASATDLKVRCSPAEGYTEPRYKFAGQPELAASSFPIELEKGN